MTLSSSTVLSTGVADAVPTYSPQWSTPKTRTLPLGEGMTPANRDALRVRLYARLNDAMPLTSRRARGLLRTLSALIACVDVEGRAIIRQEVLGERMFCTKRTVQRHIRDLEQLGLITQTRSTKRYRHYESGREGASGYQLLDTAIRDTPTPPITPPEAAQKSPPPLQKSVVMSPLEMTSCHPSGDVMSPLIGSDSEKQEQSTQATALAVGQCAALAVAVRGETHADAVAPPAPPNGVASSPPADAESNLRTAIMSVWPDMFTRQLEQAVSVFRDHPHGSYMRGLALVERGRATGKGAGWFVTATRSEQTQPTPEKTKEPRAALTGTTTTVVPMYHQRASENSEYLRNLEQAETNLEADDTDAQAYADATRRAVQTMTRAGRLGEVAAVLAQAKAMTRPDATRWLETHGCVDSEASARRGTPAHV